MTAGDKSSFQVNEKRQKRIVGDSAEVKDDEENKEIENYDM